MKALTLTQPWATMVALGHKKIETRSWPTHHRGALAIHAAKGYPKYARAVGAQLLDKHGLSPDLPMGAVVAVVDVVGCFRTETMTVSEFERELGDYSPGRYAWVLENRWEVPRPIPARGRLGLWNWEPTRRS